MSDATTLRSFAELHTLQVPELATSEQFIIGAARCWDAFLDGPDPTQAWRELAPVFAYLDVLSALCAFERTFIALRRHRVRPFVFREADSVQLNADEGRLLAALACLQRADARATVRLLRGSVTRSGMHALLPPLARIAAVLAVRGHHLPLWDDTPAVLAPAAPARCYAMG